MGDFSALAQSVIEGEITAAVANTQSALDDGGGAQEILDKGLIVAMDEVGAQFAKGDLFIPQMLRSARTMKECMKLLEPFFKKGDVASKGKVVIATVKGDLHDIGKNLVAMMMEGAGFLVVDMGIDVSPERFVEKVREVEADIVAMSALLTTTMPTMPRTIEALEEAGMRDEVKVMIGGAPVTEKYAETIKADAYAPDAGSAVIKAKKLLGFG